MNESSTPGMTYLFRCYDESQTEIYNAIEEETHRTVSSEGMIGEPLPYRLHSDWMVTSLLFICFVLVSYVLIHSSKYIQGQFALFFSKKDRNGLFDSHTSSDVRYRLVLIFQTCLLLGFCVYDYFFDHNTYLFSAVPHIALLCMYVVLIIILVLFKSLSYLFVNWIFFSKSKQKVWLDSFLNVIIWSGFLLFPIVLLIIYFNLNPQIAANSLLFVIIISKIMLFYKCFSNFFNKFYGIFHLILYFCALEIAPDIIFWKGVLFANNSLVLNF